MLHLGKVIACGGVRLELVVLLCYHVLVGRVASGYGGDVFSPLGPAFSCLMWGLLIRGFAYLWDGRVGLGLSLFVVGIRVVGGRHSGYLPGRTLLGVRLWV